MTEVKKSTLLMKIGSGPLKKYELRYVWYNPYDPFYLRYSSDPDYRGIKIVPIKIADMECKQNRDKPSAVKMIQNLQKKWKIKFSVGKKNNTKKSWTFYFQSHSEYNQWMELFNYVKTIEQPPLPPPPSSPTSPSPIKGNPHMNGSSNSIDEMNEEWWENRYGISKTMSKSFNMNNSNESRQHDDLQIAKASHIREATIYIEVELPLSMGIARICLRDIDDRVVSIRRFKERMFEMIHAMYHHNNNRNDIVDHSNNVNLKYVLRKCKLCGGTSDFLLSRQMYRQENLLEEGPEYYALQIIKTKKFLLNQKIQQIPKNHNKINSIFFQNGGLFRNDFESLEDDRLFFEFDLFRNESSLHEQEKRDLHPSSEIVVDNNNNDDDFSWVEDEDLALSSLIERVAPTRRRTIAEKNYHERQSKDDEEETILIQLCLRPMRDIPVSKFYLNCIRYTKEYDAISTFSMYILNCRNGTLKWELRRRFAQFVELDRMLREIDPQLPKFPLQATKRRRRRGIFKQNNNLSNQNDELRFIEELNVYLRQVFVTKTWEPTFPACLLSFVGVLSMGKNELMNHSEVFKRNRKVIQLNCLEEFAEFGDMVLFRSINPLSGIQRRITGNVTFDHCGIVVKRFNNRNSKSSGYELLEATGEGVTSYPLDDRLAAYSDGFCDLIAIRKIRFDRTPYLAKILADYTNRVEGKPYSLTLSKLALARFKLQNHQTQQNQIQLKQQYFCSELTAEAYRIMGIFAPIGGRPDSFFLPHFFDEGGPAEKFLQDGCSFDDVVFIDCTKPEIKYSQRIV